MRRLFLSSFFIAVLVALALMGSRALLNGDGPAHAVPPGTVDEVAIDMDPVPVYASGNLEDLAQAPNWGFCNDAIDNGGDGVADADDPDCNTYQNPASGALGATDSCKQVAVGAFWTIDVTVKGVDVADGITGYQFDLNYNPAQMTIIAVNDVQMILAAAGGSGPFFPGSEATPSNDGVYSTAGGDLGTAESGDGVLARITFQSVAAGITPLTLTGVLVVDDGVPPTPIPTITSIVNATEAQGVSCPEPQDIDNVSFEVDPASWSPALLDLDSDGQVDDVEVSVDYDYVIKDTLHNLGDDVTSPAVISIDATPDPGIEVSYHCQGGEVITLNDVVIDPNCQMGATHVASDPDVLDVHMTVGPLPISNAQVVPFNFDLHCLEPSTHSILFEKDVQPEDPVIIDDDQSNNTASTTVTVDCVAEADVKVVSQVIIPTLTQDTDGNTVPDAFLVDNGVDDDGDTNVDEDPINGFNDDGDGATDEDGGDVVEITIQKGLHNNGGYGPVNVTDVLTAAQMNPAANCGVSLLNTGPFIGGTGAGAQLALPVTTVVPASFTIYLHCGQSGYLVDDDGDAVAGSICDLNDPPAGGGIDGFLDSCIDEDPPDGIDNDGDGATDEDGPVALPMIVANNCADIKDPHVVDPNQDLDLLLAGGVPPSYVYHDACGQPAQQLLVGVLPFTPSMTVTIDDANAGAFIPAASDICMVTVPCKMQWDYTIPGGSITHQRGGTTQDRGGQPLASGLLVESFVNGPFDFTIAKGDTIPNGDVMSAISAATTLRLVPGTPCNFPVSLLFTLTDAKLPDAIEPFDMMDGFPDDFPDASTALVLNASWPGKLNAWVNVLLASNPGSQLWEREVGMTDVGTGPIPINMVVLDASGAGVGPWLYAFAIGDPDVDYDGIYDALDPDDDNDGIPDAQDKDADGNGTENSMETAQCTPFSVSVLSLGISQPGQNAITGAPTPGDSVKRVCNTISPLPPAGSGLLYGANFTRADIGESVFLTDIVGCTGESDIIASIVKDESPGDGIPGPNPPGGVDNDADTQIDEDPTLNGVDEDGDGVDGEDPVDDVVKANEPQHIPVMFDVENGAVPGDVDIKFTIVGPSVCDPTWIPETGDSPTNIVTGPVKTSIIERTESMGSGQVLWFTRKYEVNCPPGAHSFDMFNNVASASGLPDPNTDNNQAQNHPLVIATPDVDFDQVANPDDNCNFTYNPGQENLDGDDYGDACDIDDDGDGIPDPNDDCPMIPEDMDGVDDQDGCPDTDVSVSKDTEDPQEVDVSEAVTKTVTVTVTNGNYAAQIETDIVAVSLLGACEVRLIPQPGDAYLEYETDEDANTIDETLYSEIERVDMYAPGESKDISRDYTIHCYQRSTHSFEIAVDAHPLPPVVEEDQSDNVDKNFPTVHAWDQADVKKTSLAFISPPASAKVGVPFTLEVSGTIHNNGPATPVDITDTWTLVLPPNCTVTGGSFPNPYSEGTSLQLSSSMGFGLDWEVTCTEQSDHEFTVINGPLTVDTLHVYDPDTSNNSSQVQHNMVINADADVKVTSVTVTADADPATGADFNVQVDVVVHNNGPETPVNADLSVSLAQAAPVLPAVGPDDDCTLTPAAGDATQDLTLVDSVSQTITSNWTANCTDSSNHKFEASASIAVDQRHVVDPDGQNNLGAGSDTNAVWQHIEKKICDVYFGPAPVPAATTGPAADCPGVNPWDGGVDEIAVVPSTTVDLVSDDLDYSSDAVNIKKTATLTAAAGGPQVCDILTIDQDLQVPGIQQIFQEAEPPGLSVQPQPLDWEIHLPLPVHDGEPNWCLLDYKVVKEIKDLHVTDNTPGDTEVIITDILVAADTDGDGVYDNAAGELDNCKLVPNPGQEDSNGNGTGDVCDLWNDVGEKYITVLGPAAINLSDTNGRYMWVIGEMGNFSQKYERVTITLEKDPPMPTGCTQDDDLILPGQSEFLLMAGEQKFQVYRVRFECHNVTPQIITLEVEKCIEIDPLAKSHDDDGDTQIDEDSRDGVDDDGDSEDGEDPPNPDDVPENDCKSTTKQVIID